MKKQKAIESHFAAHHFDGIYRLLSSLILDTEREKGIHFEGKSISIYWRFTVSFFDIDDKERSERNERKEKRRDRIESFKLTRKRVGNQKKI